MVVALFHNLIRTEDPMTICNKGQLAKALGLKQINFRRLEKSGIIKPFLPGFKPLYCLESVREQIKRATKNATAVS